MVSLLCLFPYPAHWEQTMWPLSRLTPPEGLSCFSFHVRHSSAMRTGHPRREEEAGGRVSSHDKQLQHQATVPGKPVAACFFTASHHAPSLVVPAGSRSSCGLPSSTPQPSSHRWIPCQAQHGAMSPLWARPFKSLTSRIPGATPRNNKKKTPSPKGCQHLQLSSLRQQKKGNG